MKCKRIPLIKSHEYSSIPVQVKIVTPQKLGNSIVHQIKVVSADIIRLMNLKFSYQVLEF